jgi:hypothetical protein
MIRLFSLIRTTAQERSAERHFQRAWERASSRAGSDSHLDEINEIFARVARGAR